MERDAELRIRIPRETLTRIDLLLAKDPKCPSKNYWMLEIINDILDEDEKEPNKEKND
ncbi:MAG: hypothetical protein KAS32_31635 [Candidatus Peribacteraceae bacterium]|nr:hypothetical protein [Candidatus Peribacteraceae bacterium]